MAILRGIMPLTRMFMMACLLYSLTSMATAIVDKGKLVSLNGVDYLAGGVAVSQLSSSRNLNWNWTLADTVPLTIVRTNATTFTSNELEKIITGFQLSDDVFAPGFMEGLLISSSTIAVLLIDHQNTYSSHLH